MEHDEDARHRVVAGRMRRCASRAVELPRARSSMPIPSCGCGWMTAPLANSTVDAAITIQQRQATQVRGRRRQGREVHRLHGAVQDMLRGRK